MAATVLPKCKYYECHYCHQASIHFDFHVSFFDCFHFVWSYMELLIGSMTKRTLFLKSQLCHSETHIIFLENRVNKLIILTSQGYCED